MKLKIIIVTAIITAYPFCCFAGSLTSYTDKDGKTVWTNSGPSTTNGESNQAAFNRTVDALVYRHPELGGNDNLRSTLINQAKKYRDNQGESPQRSLELAERDLINAEYLSGKKRKPKKVVAKRKPVQRKTYTKKRPKLNENGLTAAQQKHLDEMARKEFSAGGFTGRAAKEMIRSQNAKNRKAIDRLRAQYVMANQGQTYQPATTRAGTSSNQPINTPAANNLPANIHGEWDTQGKHYTPANGGNLWRSDGVFMQKAAGGYINTKTGQFVPSN